jgi:hypothetical protein
MGRERRRRETMKKPWKDGSIIIIMHGSESDV